MSVGLCPEGVPLCNNTLRQKGASVGDTCTTPCAPFQGGRWCPTTEDRSGGGGTPWGWCAIGGYKQLSEACGGFFPPIGQELSKDDPDVMCKRGITCKEQDFMGLCKLFQSGVIPRLNASECSTTCHTREVANYTALNNDTEAARMFQGLNCAELQALNSTRTKRGRAFEGSTTPPPEPLNSTTYVRLVAQANGSVPGCAFSHALNYDTSATRDDGSCNFSSSLLGNRPPCNDPFADNFNSRSPVSYPGACKYSCNGIYATLKKGWALHKDSPRARWVPRWAP